MGVILNERRASTAPCFSSNTFEIRKNNVHGISIRNKKDEF
jgi:hypothetical protein